MFGATAYEDERNRVDEQLGPASFVGDGWRLSPSCWTSTSRDGLGSILVFSSGNDATSPGYGAETNPVLNHAIDGRCCDAGHATSGSASTVRI